MILYQVYQGVITAMSVAKETNSGWRLHNNGFINRLVLKGNPHLESRYYTTDINEANKWHKQVISHIYSVLQVADASVHDLDFWVEELNMDEESITKSRIG